jgi:hypothetical protein
MLLSAHDKLACCRLGVNCVREQAADKERKNIIILYLHNDIRLLDNAHGADVAVEKGD